MRSFASFHFAQDDVSLKKLFAFSLVELMISLITISCIAAAFTPVITKKLKKQDVALSLAQTSEITDKYSGYEPKFTDKCKLCTKAYCIQCSIDSCEKGQYVDTSYCGCKACNTVSKIASHNLSKNKCVSCTKDGCTECSNAGSDEGKYYINNGLCENCPSASNGTIYYCDGINATSDSDCQRKYPLSSGYYCQNGQPKLCSTKYGTSCMTCDINQCKSCDRTYRYTGTGCEPCTDRGCFSCPSNKDICTSCNCGFVENGKCVSCDANIKGCLGCTSRTVCTNCTGGYYLNTAKTCSYPGGIRDIDPPVIEGCLTYSNNQPSNSPACSNCEPLYFLDGKRCSKCSTKFGTNCAICDSTKCLSCAQGYHLTSTPNNANACDSDKSEFNCSDSNFMKIPNPEKSGSYLCVTRKNMGDSNVLTIPKEVTVVQTGGDYCYTNNQLCCFQGSTGGSSCGVKYGTYSSCTRTSCNYEAAKVICEKFNYAGLKWRIPTSTEQSTWGTMSKDDTTSGMQICGCGQDAPMCCGVSSCMGAGQGNNCQPFRYWNTRESDTRIAARTKYFGGVSWYDEWVSKFMAASVRCVADMP